jgi:hypothetical protein
MLPPPFVLPLIIVDITVAIPPKPVLALQSHDPSGLIGPSNHSAGTIIKRIHLLSLSSRVRVMQISGNDNNTYSVRAPSRRPHRHFGTLGAPEDGGDPQKAHLDQPLQRAGGLARQSPSRPRRGGGRQLWLARRYWRGGGAGATFGAQSETLSDSPECRGSGVRKIGNVTACPPYRRKQAV